ncbi:trypsin, alkaline B-like [Armigeres subalbatus]|uniref:trypsin, alkaline B-like n=1 Tax=Armigeres subalbatus TaxID=124917 RepID=UPI002ED60BBE
MRINRKLYLLLVSWVHVQYKHSIIAFFPLGFSLSNGYRLHDDEYDPFDPFVSGGTNSVLGQFPSVVAVGVPTPANAFCGGVILNENHVLTVARCVLTPQSALLYPSQITIMSGVLQLNFAAPRIEVSAVYVHPQYNPFTFANNLAVLRTKRHYQIKLQLYRKPGMNLSGHT